MKRWTPFWKTVACALLTAVWLSPVHAAVHFAALPGRAAARLTLTAAGALVVEDRMLNLEPGINEIRFSWEGLSISEESVRLSIPDAGDQAGIVSMSRPPGEAAMIWQVHCSTPLLAAARVSYVLFRMDGLFTLRLTSDRDETSARLERRLVLRNFSGEDFENLSVSAGAASVAERPVRHGETVRTLLFTDDGVRIRKIWRYDTGKVRPRPHPETPEAGIPVYYRVTNTAEGGLGKGPVQGGKVRIYHRDGTGKTSLLGEDRMETIYPGRHGEILVGESREISVTAAVMKRETVNEKRNRDNRVVLHDTDEVLRFVIENFKDSPAALQIVHRIPGEWRISGASTPYTKKDAHTVEFDLMLEPGGVKELTLEYRRLNVRP